MAERSKTDDEWEALLPELGSNKKFKEKKKSLARLKAKAEAREMSRKMKSKKQSTVKSKSIINGKKKIKRAPKTVINNMKTGKETLRKAKARELVKERKDAERQARKEERKLRIEKQQSQLKDKNIVTSTQSIEKEKGKIASKPHLLHSPTEKAQKEPNEKRRDVPEDSNVDTHTTSPELHVAKSPINRKEINEFCKGTAENKNREETVNRAALERVLIDRVIRGEVNTNNGDNINHNRSVHDSTNDNNAISALLENDHVVHSHLPFLDDYVAKKSAEVVSQDELLHNAHVYFSELSHQEQALHKVAAQRLRELKRINRHGGDKDGFRYVVPRNVKEMTKQLLATRNSQLNAPPSLHGMKKNTQNGSASQPNFTQSEEALINGDELASSFRGDDLTYGEPHISSRHRKRRRQNTFSDFYQFQVSRQWTKNAENFLRKGRASKSLFESRKQHRSIRKL